MRRRTSEPRCNGVALATLLQEGEGNQHPPPPPLLSDRLSLRTRKPTSEPITRPKPILRQSSHLPPPSRPIVCSRERRASYRRHCPQRSRVARSYARTCPRARMGPRQTQGLDERAQSPHVSTPRPARVRRHRRARRRAPPATSFACATGRRRRGQSRAPQRDAARHQSPRREESRNQQEEKSPETRKPRGSPRGFRPYPPNPRDQGCGPRLDQTSPAKARATSDGCSPVSSPHCDRCASRCPAELYSAPHLRHVESPHPSTTTLPQSQRPRPMVRTFTPSTKSTNGRLSTFTLHPPRPPAPRRTRPRA